MGNLITKLTTNNIELNESNVSEVVFSVVAKEKSPSATVQTRTGIFKNLLNFDPRSPSTLITRTPIAMFRNNSAGKFNHQELNESIESQVDLDILTPEEQDSLDLNKDLTEIADESNGLPDPRSPITEITRTPIIIPDDGAKKKEDNLMKKLAEKLITTAISNEEDKKAEEKPEKAAAKKAKNKKNLIYQDDDLDMYSTPPKKAMKDGASSRTPLSCVANTNTPKSRSQIPTSTPKNLINFNDENAKSVSRIPVSSARRLH